MSKAPNLSMAEHVRALVANVVNDKTSDSVRAAHARTVSDAYRDLADAYRAGQAVLGTGRAADLFAVLDKKSSPNERDEAQKRIATRAGLEELRAWFDDFAGVLPTPAVLTNVPTGIGVFPLIREVAQEWTAGAGVAPVVPGVADDTDSAAIDPATPVTSTSITIDDVGGGTGNPWQSAAMVVNLALQLAWLTPEGRDLLDRAVFDAVDHEADKAIAAALVAAAGDTRAAGADLGAALDDAERAAGTRDLVRWLVVNPTDLPLVRRELAPTFYEGPHPVPLVSTGQPAGTATLLGNAAMHLFRRDYMTGESSEPKLFGRGAYVIRPFYLAIRDEDAIQTVTGIGA